MLTLDYAATRLLNLKISLYLMQLRQKPMGRLDCIVRRRYTSL